MDRVDWGLPRSGHCGEKREGERQNGVGKWESEQKEREGGKSTESAIPWHPAADLEVSAVPLRSILHPAAFHDEASSFPFGLINARSQITGNCTWPVQGEKKDQEEIWGNDCFLPYKAHHGEGERWERQGGCAEIVFCQMTPAKPIWKFIFSHLAWMQDNWGGGGIPLQS